MSEYKYVTWRNLKCGDKIIGYKADGKLCLRNLVVKGVNVCSVVLDSFGTEITLNSEDTMFQIELSKEEFNNKYKNKAVEVVKALSNIIDEQEAGYHEMWNGWIDSDPYVMASECSRNNMKIVGVVRLLVQKTSLCGNKLDIGICCEYENGERFWCHAYSSTVEFILDYYKDLVS